MEHNEQEHIRRHMTVIMLNTDPTNSDLLQSVRVIEQFVSNQLDYNKLVDHANETLLERVFNNDTAAEEKRRAISYKAMDAVRSNTGQRPKVSPAKVQLAIELLQGGWLSHRELSNRVKLKIGTVRTTLIPAVKREIPHSLKFKRERFGAQGKYKYHLKDVRAFK